MAAYIHKLILIIIVLAPFYILLRRPWKYAVYRELALGGFVLFMAALMALVFQGTYGTPYAMAENAVGRIRSREGINLVPFRTIGSLFRRGIFTSDAFWVNVVGNIVMFVPWGLGLALLWKKNRSPWRILAFSAMLPLFIETCQLFIGRSVDVDDLILNFLGGCLGGLLYMGIRRIFPFCCIE